MLGMSEKYNSLAWGVKKTPVVPVPDRPYFFLPTLLFFQRD
jgi:hypothetical protein